MFRSPAARLTGALVYNSAVGRTQLKPILRRTLTLTMLLAGSLRAAAQTAQSPPPPASSASPQTKIQLSFVNSCRPGAPEAEQMKRLLLRFNETPRFSADFEISRGLTTLTGEEARAAGLATQGAATPSSWVRIRREFPERAPLTDAQYSLSLEAGSVSESLTLHLRDSREALQISISTAATGSAGEMLKADTPPARISIERFGKASIVLARCAGADQSSYEPLFQAAAEIFQRYRAAMAVRSVVPAELTHLPAVKESGESRGGAGMEGKESGGKESWGKESKAPGTNH